MGVDHGDPPVACFEARTGNQGTRAPGTGGTGAKHFPNRVRDGLIVCRWLSCLSVREQSAELPPIWEIRKRGRYLKSAYTPEEGQQQSSTDAATWLHGKDLAREKAANFASSPLRLEI